MAAERDAQLLRDAQRGDSRSLARLTEKIMDVFKREALFEKLGRHREDVIQDSMLEFLERIAVNGFTCKHIRAYAKKIFHRNATDLINSKKQPRDVLRPQEFWDDHERNTMEDPLNENPLTGKMRRALDLADRITGR